MKIGYVLLSIAILTGLSACQREKDPRKAGFVSGVLNLSDGTYDKRLAEKEKRNQDQKLANAQAEQTNEERLARKQLLEDRLKRARKKVADLESRIKAAQRNAANDSARLAELREAKRQLDIQQAKIDKAEAEGDGNAVAVAMRNVARLEESSDL